MMHGRDGWKLEIFDWDPDTGLATLTYERRNPATGELETVSVQDTQPTETHHAGWNSRSRAFVY